MAIKPHFCLLSWFFSISAAETPFIKATIYLNFSEQKHLLAHTENPLPDPPSLVTMLPSLSNILEYKGFTYHFT